jgi:hypothetical protein
LYLAQSLAHDGDLNILNNLPFERRWLKTLHGTYPLMHDYGVVLFWVPFIKVLNILSVGYARQLELLTIFNAVLGCTGIALLYRIIIDHFKLQLSAYATCAIIISSGVFSFIFFENTFADTIIIFYLAIFTQFTLSNTLNKSNQFYFFWGMALGLGITIKISFIFYTILFFLIESRKSFKNYLTLLFGLALLLLPKFLIMKDLNGELLPLQGYSIIYSLDVLTSPVKLYRKFFSPSGLLYNFPLIGFLLPFVLFKIVKNKVLLSKGLRKITLLLTISFALNVILHMTCIFDGNLGFGNRHYSSGIFLYLLLTAIFMKFKRIIILNLALFFSSIWALFQFYWNIQIDSGSTIEFNAQPTPLFLLIEYDFYKAIYFQILNSFSLISIYDTILASIAIFSAYGLTALFIIKKNYLSRFFLFFAIANILILITNHYSINYNPHSKQVSLPNGVIGRGANIFLYEEFVSTYSYALDIAKINSDYKEHQFIKNKVNNYLKACEKEIINDEINFLVLLGKKNFKPLTIQDEKGVSDINNTLDFTKPVRFSNYNNAIKQMLNH